MVVADEESFHIVPLAQVCGSTCWWLAAPGFWICGPVAQALQPEREKRLAASRPKMCKLANLGRSSFWGLEPIAKVLSKWGGTQVSRVSNEDHQTTIIANRVVIGDILLFKQSMDLERKELIQVSWVALVPLFRSVVWVLTSDCFRMLRCSEGSWVKLWCTVPVTSWTIPEAITTQDGGEKMARTKSLVLTLSAVSTKMAILQEKWHSLSKHDSTDLLKV